MLIQVFADYLLVGINFLDERLIIFILLFCESYSLYRRTRVVRPKLRMNYVIIKGGAASFLSNVTILEEELLHKLLSDSRLVGMEQTFPDNSWSYRRALRFDGRPRLTLVCSFKYVSTSISSVSTQHVILPPSPPSPLSPSHSPMSSVHLQ